MANTAAIFPNGNDNTITATKWELSSTLQRGVTTTLLQRETTPTLSTNQTGFAIFDIEEFLSNKDRAFVASLIPTVCYLGLGMMLGLAGNTLVFVVYHQRFKPSVIRTYILAMSVGDLLNNMLSLPAEIVEICFHNTFDERWLCKSFRAVKNFLTFFSAYVLVAVAFDRQRAICHPHSNPATVKHANGVIVVASLTAVATVIPYTILTGPMTVRYEEADIITGLECSIENEFVGSLFLFVYNMVTGVGLVASFGVMLVSYVLIARHLWLHKKNTAIVMNNSASSAGNGNKVKVANPRPKTLHAGESSSSTTNGSSSINDKLQTRVELSHQSGQYHEDAVQDSSQECPDNKRALSKPSPQATHSNLDDNPQILTITEDQGYGFQVGSTSSSDTKGSSVKAHNNGGSGSSSSKLPGSRPSSDDDCCCSFLSKLKALVSGKKSTGQNPPAGSVKKIPNQTTFMMFVLTVVFIVNFVPHLVLVLLFPVVGMGPLLEVLGVNGYHIGVRSYFINSFINPLVYCFCSFKFRQECCLLFSCKAK